MSQPAADLPVATATGQGAGRFLAAALLDTLSGGGTLVWVTEAPAPQRSTRGFDFVFASVDGATSEVLRAGTNQRSELVCAQLLRRSQPIHGPESPRALELAQALRVSKAVGFLRWQEQEDGFANLEVVLLPHRMAVLLPARIESAETSLPDSGSPQRPGDGSSIELVGLEE